MNFSFLRHSNNTRPAVSARDILSVNPGGTVLGLFLMLLLLAGVGAGSQSVLAEEAAPAPAPATVNINTADAQTLAANLKGVGEARALEIVRYREAYGPFGSAEELTEVKGIGQSTLDMNRNVITLE